MPRPPQYFVLLWKNDDGSVLDSAVESARSYLDSSHFSRQSLIDQLEFEGFTSSDAALAADSLAPDWFAEAAEGAQSWIESEYFEGTRQDILEILISIHYFLQEQAEYGATAVGY